MVSEKQTIHLVYWRPHDDNQFVVDSAWRDPRNAAERCAVITEKSPGSQTFLSPVDLEDTGEEAAG